MTTIPAVDPRYPIGRFVRPTSFTAESRKEAIAAIAGLPAALRAAVHGLSDVRLDTPYRPEGWTVRQLAHHLADAHVNAYIRTRLALTEDHPTIKPYNQVRWAELPDAKKGPLAPSLDLLEALHTRWVALLSTLTPEQFARPFHHPESGTLSLDILVAEYAWESNHHVAQITELRRRSGW